MNAQRTRSTRPRTPSRGGASIFWRPLCQEKAGPKKASALLPGPTFSPHPCSVHEFPRILAHRPGFCMRHRHPMAPRTGEPCWRPAVFAASPCVPAHARRRARTEAGSICQNCPLLPHLIFCAPQFTHWPWRTDSRKPHGWSFLHRTRNGTPSPKPSRTPKPPERGSVSQKTNGQPHAGTQGPRRPLRVRSQTDHPKRASLQTPPNPYAGYTMCRSSMP